MGNDSEVGENDDKGERWRELRERKRGTEKRKENEGNCDEGNI